MNHIPSEFKTISALVSYASGESLTEVQGVKDTPCKIWACYFAKKVTNYSDAVIAQAYQINPNYMKSRLEDFSIGFLVDSENNQIMEQLCDLYRNLVDARASA